MITENLSTLKIHKLTKEQYERELAAGRIDENAVYLTPDEKIDLSSYATIEQLNTKANVDHNHNTDYDIKGEADTALTSAKAYTDTQIDAMVGDETVKNQINAAVANKSDANHTHTEYAAASDLAALEGLVGDTKVSDQINTAIETHRHPMYGETSDGGYRKSVTCDGFVLEKGATIRVKFTADNTENNSLYLDINNTGSKQVYYLGAAIPCMMFLKNYIYDFVYDGTNYVVVDTPKVVATATVDGFMSSTDKKKLNNIAAGAEVNQNAFSKITVGETTIEADSKSDTLLLSAGANITLTANADMDMITIAAKNTLPIVYAADNGKFLRVVDGKWAVVSIPNAEEASF